LPRPHSPRSSRPSSRPQSSRSRWDTGSESAIPCFLPVARDGTAGSHRLASAQTAALLKHPPMRKLTRLSPSAKVSWTARKSVKWQDSRCIDVVANPFDRSLSFELIWGWAKAKRYDAFSFPCKLIDHAGSAVWPCYPGVLQVCTAEFSQGTTNRTSEDLSCREFSAGRLADKPKSPSKSVLKTSY
jgi:hypothetical protein